MIKYTRLLFVALFLAPPLQSEDAFPLREAVECQPRGGLPNVLEKLESGQTVKVAYLGGSITAAAGWRVQSREWLQTQYPDSTIEEIHAAIGGTGSDLGVFRLGQDVLRHEPDLLLVEFAVNDGGAAPDRIQKGMEGIVRQTWAANPLIDICYVYTLTEKMLPDLKAGKMPRAASAMEELADHYEIPSIHFGVEVARLESAGELVFKAPKPAAPATAKPIVFSSDGVHPHVETGHRLYSEAIARSWPTIEASSQKSGPHELGEALQPDNWERAKMVPIQPDMLKGDWTTWPDDHAVGKWFARSMPVVHQAQTPGAQLHFQFEGTSVALFDIVGPDCGILEVQVDDLEPQIHNRFDPHCKSHRMSIFYPGKDLAPGIHHVTITLTPTRIDKRSILFDQYKSAFDAEPEKYGPHTWSLGSIMLIGDLK